LTAKITIRPAQPNDEEELFLLAQSFASSFAVERSSFSASFDALLQSPDAYLAVASRNGRVIGYLLGFDHRAFFANGRVAWVEEIMVAEDMRRLGAGSLLMASIEEWSRGHQTKLIALATRRAADFYRSLGYEESATYFRRLL
jgi:GNAT superfamily N-acetyltransferase